MFGAKHCSAGLGLIKVEVHPMLPRGGGRLLIWRRTARAFCYALAPGTGIRVALVLVYIVNLNL